VKPEADPRDQPMLFRLGPLRPGTIILRAMAENRRCGLRRIPPECWKRFQCDKVEATTPGESVEFVLAQRTSKFRGWVKV
jgi:hypothetical protein